MILTSWIKSSILSGADDLNSLFGGPQRFTRSAIPDSSALFSDDEARRTAIAVSSERELVDFVSDGVFIQSRPNDLGDCAIWQGIYTAMTVMRWCDNKDAVAEAEMLAAATALSRYFYQNAREQAILVRGAMPTSLLGTFFNVDAANSSRYFVDGDYTYREDASLDSLLGVMFGAAIVNRFGDDASRAIIADLLECFSSGFSKAGFNVVNRGGPVTTYGSCAPGFAQAPVRVLASALPSLVSGGTDWTTIAASYSPEFATTDTQIPGKISWVNAHLAMLANLTYVAAAPPNAPGLSDAVNGLRKLLAKYSDAGNSFLVYACEALGVTPTQDQMDKAAKILLEFPIGSKPVAGLNSSVASALQPVPVWQRPPVDVIWQRSPYPYSGNDSMSYSRLDYLIAHYLSRRTS